MQNVRQLCGRSLSALGHKRTFCDAKGHVRFTPGCRHSRPRAEFIALRQGMPGQTHTLWIASNLRAVVVVPGTVICYRLRFVTTPDPLFELPALTVRRGDPSES